MMDISHLYHDATFGDPTLELDVKEQLKTRIVNAREERHLEMLSKSYDKAKDICEKNTAWERWKVGQSLHGIWERSPHLERSLAMEKARVEQLQKSILLRNFRMRKKASPQQIQMKPMSPVIRSISNTTLDPINRDSKRPKRKRQRRKKKPQEETDGLTHSITERHLQRPGDFARRTEHVVKSLAKLNWRQQNRRRDHEKFKEELKLHSKPVIEKARVILKGRSDIDVETMMSDFENILLPYQRAENSVSGSTNRYSTFTNSLTRSNILQLADVNDSRSHLHSLSGSSVTLPSETKADIKNDNNYILTPERNLESTSTTSTSTLGKDKNEDTIIIKQSPEVENKVKKSNNEHQRPVHIRSLNGICGTEKNDYKTEKVLLPETPLCEKGVVSPVRPKAKILINGRDEKKNNLEVFSPTSVSHVIIEEEEEGEETTDVAGDQKTDHDPKEPSSAVDNNNNDLNSIPVTPQRTNKLDTYTMTHTTGLPQLWKLGIQKKKEKAIPEVSAATIARKHKRKRNESERRW